jgi:Glucosyl transferase GtrII
MSRSEPTLAQPLTEPSVGISAGYAEVAARRRSLTGIRSWVLTAFLFLVPLVAYWPTTFHDYGLRDDYSNLRESHEEPGKILQFCASHARPIYGLLLQSTYGQTSSVDNLRWMRLGASLILGAVSLVLFRGLRALGWSFEASLCVALMLGLLPASQVIAAWAVGWPYAATALLGLGAFFAVESALAMAPGAVTLRLQGRLLAQWMVGLGLMVISALIYQPSALFYVVPLAAALIAQRGRGSKQTARWAGAHLSFIAAALGLAYCTMTVLYSMRIFVKSGRVAFEHHWGEKLGWFLGEALPNGLSMLVLNDNHHHDRWLYLGCAGLVGLVLLAGACLEWRRHGWQRGVIWLCGLFALPVIAFGISLVASERYATYRTLLAMSAVLVCFLVASLGALTARWAVPNRRLLATVLLSVAFLTARHHAYALIAVPQGNEWQLIVEGAKQVRLSVNSRPRIFAIASRPADISTATIYHDEFGSLSSNSEWVPKEMFKRAMHDLHPEIANINSRYAFATGPALPSDQQYDVIIDMRRLRQFYSDN